MRTAIAEDFGLHPLDAIKFDPKRMTVDGCKCGACWLWKTTSDNRVFWRLKSTKQDPAHDPS